MDVHQDLFVDGDLDESVAEAYEEELLRLFRESPEGTAVLEKESKPGWARMMVQYGLNYPGVTPATMNGQDLSEVVFDIFPRKVACSAEDANEIVCELRAFWAFLGREFGLKNAPACLNVLGEHAIKKLERKLADPANFGMAKSFFVAGQEAGFDVTSQEGLDAWMKTCNGHLETPRLSAPPMKFEDRIRIANRRVRERKTRRKKR